ncbi:MAG: hypothetical protein M0C28_21745 [Candidatus Moduliflexus flocculans]|nr:hypothetical protein [Candidatus Moduliflexus flocculans]
MPPARDPAPRSDHDEPPSRADTPSRRSRAGLPTALAHDPRHRHRRRPSALTAGGPTSRSPPSFSSSPGLHSSWPASGGPEPSSSPWA